MPVKNSERERIKSASADQENFILSASPKEIYDNVVKTFDVVWKDSKDPEANWTEYDPDALIFMLLGESAGQEAKDKVLAVQALCYDPEMVLSSAPVFENVINAFNNNPLVIDQMQPPFMEELFYGVQQIKQIVLAHTNRDSEFKAEIPNYVAALAKYHGMAILPKPLAFAQEMLDSLSGTQIQSEKRKEYFKLLEAIKTLSDELDRVQYSSRDLETVLDRLGASEGAYSNCMLSILRCYAYNFKQNIKN